MSQRKHSGHFPPADSAAPRRRNAWVLSTVIAIAIVVSVMLLRTNPPPPAPVAQPAPASAPVKETSAQRLVGRWVRPDGGYVLEMRSAAADGKLDAGYFNPQPINVSRAEWRREAGALKVFVELRDVNYPGSTYNLALSADEARLTGIYHQAAVGQNFEVDFVRER